MKVYCIFIVINEEQYIAATLKSYLQRPEVQAIAVIEGADRLYQAADVLMGLSLDNTADVAVATLKNAGSGRNINAMWNHQYHQYGWAENKAELWNAALNLLRGAWQPQPEDWIVMCSGDELYTDEQWGLLYQTMQANPEAKAIYITPYHFWKDFDHLTMGGQWDVAMPRAFRYCDDSIHFVEHNLPPLVTDGNGKAVGLAESEILWPAIHVHHYGAVKDGESIRAKLDYYKRRDDDLDVRDTWTNYKEGDETQWTHGGGYAVKTLADHPAEIRELMMDEEWCRKWGVA